MYITKTCASHYTLDPLFITLKFIFYNILTSLKFHPPKKQPGMHTLLLLLLLSSRKPSNKNLYKLNTSNFSKIFSNVEGSVSLEVLEHEYFTNQHSVQNLQNSKNSNISENFSDTECLERLEIKTLMHLYRPQTNFFQFYNLLSGNFSKSVTTYFRTFSHYREKGTQPCFTQVQNFCHRDTDPNQLLNIAFQQASLPGNFAKQHPSNTFKTFSTPEGSVRYATLSRESSHNFGNIIVSFERLKKVVSISSRAFIPFYTTKLKTSQGFHNNKHFLPNQRIHTMIYDTTYYMENCYTIAPTFYTVTPQKNPARTYRSVLSNLLHFYRRPIDQSPISWSQTNRHRRG